MDRLYKQLYAKCLRYLGLKLCSEQELREKMELWIREIDWSNYEATSQIELIDRVIDQLKRERFVDDTRLAHEWVVSRLKRGKRGPGVIRMELQHKGVDKELVMAALAEVEKEELGVDELSGARLAAEKYLRKLAGKEPREQRSKLYAHLAGKGFRSSIVSTLVQELLS